MKHNNTSAFEHVLENQRPKRACSNPQHPDRIVLTDMAATIAEPWPYHLKKDTLNLLMNAGIGSRTKNKRHTCMHPLTTDPKHAPTNKVASLRATQLHKQLELEYQGCGSQHLTQLASDS